MPINTLLQKMIQKINPQAGKPDNSANKEELPGRRAAIVDALNKSIEIFSANKEDTFDEVMTNGIKPFADAADLDRVVFYMLVNRYVDKRLGQVYRWDKSEGGLMSIAEDWYYSRNNRWSRYRYQKSKYSTGCLRYNH